MLLRPDRTHVNVPKFLFNKNADVKPLRNHVRDRVTREKFSSKQLQSTHPPLLDNSSRRLLCVKQLTLSTKTLKFEKLFWDNLYLIITNNFQNVENVNTSNRAHFINSHLIYLKAY